MPYTVTDHERDVSAARQRAEVVVAWKRVNAARLPVDVASADRLTLRRAGVILSGHGEVWCSDAAANARSMREMLDVLRSLKPSK